MKKSYLNDTNDRKIIFIKQTENKLSSCHAHSKMYFTPTRMQENFTILHRKIRSHLLKFEDDFGTIYLNVELLNK